MSGAKHLAHAILKHLQQEAAQNPQEDKVESLEVAIQCLENVYEISAEDASPLPASLQVIFDKGLEQLGGVRELPAAEPALSQKPVDKEKAEKCKAEGNELMKKEQYQEALVCYTEAINSDTNNAVYYCNRAAAHSKLNNHSAALEDCNSALKIDPNYSKAYGRKGIAHSALGQHTEAVGCYQKALELDPSNASYSQNLEIAEQKVQEQGDGGMPGMPGGMPGMPGGMPGMPGMPGGMPNLGGLNMGGMDFSAILNNPALMNMATNMMQNPQMQNMMANLMSGGSDAGGPQGLSGLLQAGQRMAQQMQESNPELIDQLRTQYRENPDDPGSGEGGNEQQ